MNPAKLMLSAALASLMLFTPAVFTTADAAGIKIKPQIVKVRPKIKIAKPKVRVKVRAAKVRIKPKVKVKVRTTKIQIKPKVKVKVRAANVKMKPKVQLQAVQLTQRPKVVKPKTQISQTAKTALTVAAINSHSRGRTELRSGFPKTGSHPLPNHPDRGPKVSIAPSTPGTGVNTGVSYPTKPRNTPTLDVPGGISDVLSVSGGVLNDEFRNAADLDALRGVGAMQDFLKDGFGLGRGPITDDHPLGRPRFGAGMFGAPMGSAGAPSDLGDVTLAVLVQTTDSVSGSTARGTSEYRLWRFPMRSSVLRPSRRIVQPLFHRRSSWYEIGHKTTTDVLRQVQKDNSEFPTDVVRLLR